MTHPSRSARLMPIAGVLLLGACASPGPGAEFSARDPFEETNRSIHGFNVALDRNVLRPVSQGYDLVTPTLIQHMLGNAFSHLDTLNDFLNYTLQGEIEPAGTALGRLTVNTILGAGGLLDPATEFGLPKQDTDFGVTLGTYGVEEGAFLMLPFFGPSTTRDLGGLAGDMALNPLTYTGFFDSNALNFFSVPYNTVEIVDSRARNASTVDEILYNSPDSYVALRAIYLQRRDRLIYGDDLGEETLPDIFDEDPVE